MAVRWTGWSPCSAAAASSAAMSAQALLQGRRAGAHRPARSAPRLFPEAARRGRPDPVRRAPTSATPTASRARSQGATRWSIWSACSRAISRRVHVDGARNVAEAARAAGASALVQVSAIGADPEVAIRLWPHQGRRRGGGARGLSRARPSSARRSCSGPRTSSSTASPRMARLLPVVPVIAADSAASSRSMSPTSARRSPRRRSIPAAHGGKTYELGGPQVLTHARAATRAICAIDRPAARARRPARFRRRR